MDNMPDFQETFALLGGVAAMLRFAHPKFVKIANVHLNVCEYIFTNVLSHWWCMSCVLLMIIALPPLDVLKCRQHQDVPSIAGTAGVGGPHGRD